MLFDMTACPMAAVIMILVIVTILLDAFMLFGPVFVIRFDIRVLGVIFFLFTIVYVLFTLWLANKTCYNFIWVSWVIVFYLLFAIMNTIGNIIDPSRKEQIQKDIDAAINESVL